MSLLSIYCSIDTIENDIRSLELISCKTKPFYHKVGVTITEFTPTGCFYVAIEGFEVFPTYVVNFDGAGNFIMRKNSYNPLRSALVSLGAAIIYENTWQGNYPGINNMKTLNLCTLLHDRTITKGTPDFNVPCINLYYRYESDAVGIIKSHST